MADEKSGEVFGQLLKAVDAAAFGTAKVQPMDDGSFVISWGTGSDPATARANAEKMKKYNDSRPEWGSGGG